MARTLAGIWIILNSCFASKHHKWRWFDLPPAARTRPSLDNKKARKWDELNCSQWHCPIRPKWWWKGSVSMLSNMVTMSLMWLRTYMWLVLLRKLILNFINLHGPMHPVTTIGKAHVYSIHFFFVLPIMLRNQLNKYLFDDLIGGFGVTFRFYLILSKSVTTFPLSTFHIQNWYSIAIWKTKNPKWLPAQTKLLNFIKYKKNELYWFSRLLLIHSPGL